MINKKMNKTQTLTWIIQTSSSIHHPSCLEIICVDKCFSTLYFEPQQI